MRGQAAIAARRSALVASSLFGIALGGCGGSDGPSPTVSLAVAPATITLGQSATVSWSLSQGVICAAGGGWSGARDTTGTRDVTPEAAGTVTYALTCSGGGYRGGITRAVTLTVDPASAYTATSLVEDLPGGAARTADDLLVNAWGIAYGPTSAIWVANNHSDTATIYDGNGRPSPLIVHVAPSAGAAAFAPTGLVFNDTMDFVVGEADRRGPARFIFVGETGAIAGWSPTSDVLNAVTTYTATDGAVYKGLAIAGNANGNFLYATDFANGKIDIFDGRFARQASTATSFAFDDPTLPAGYSPFGIQAIANGADGATQIYVSYAKHDTSEPDDDAPGPGLGLVNVFDTNGHLLKHVVAEGGKLNAPWGMALAPADFGTLSNSLLVGNFGDGTIQGYDPASGRYLGAVTDGTGTAFAVPGLWGIAFGNDAVNQPHATLFFAAGTNGEVHGRYGRIDLGQTAPALGDAPAVSLTTPQDDLSGTVTLTANATSSVAIARVRFLLNGSTPIGTATSEPFTVQWDTTTVPNGTATLRAIAIDDNGNVGSSLVVPVTVANPGPGP